MQSEIAAEAADFSWATVIIKFSGNVPRAYWSRDDKQANLNAWKPDNHDENVGARPVVRVYGPVWSDLSQPPSIRPISSSLAWAWKIFVSLVNPNSKNKRNLSIANSTKLEARIKYGDFNGFGAFLAIINSRKESRIVSSRLEPKAYRRRFSR